jgi:nitroreductase
MTLSIAEVNKIKHNPAVDGLLPAIAHRWSPRAFDGRPVSSADLTRVFEAARWAASSSNEQPWRYVVGVQGSDTYNKIFSTLVAFNKAWAGKASVLILGVASAKTGSGRPNGYALYDLGAATAMLTLQAAELGLATHQMGGYDQQAAREALEIPADYALGSVIALGYQAEPASLANDQLIEREVTLRERKPLHDFVFSAWGTPADLA